MEEELKRNEYLEIEVPDLIVWSLLFIGIAWFLFVFGKEINSMQHKVMILEQRLSEQDERLQEDDVSLRNEFMSHTHKFQGSKISSAIMP